MIKEFVFRGEKSYIATCTACVLVDYEKNEDSEYLDYLPVWETVNGERVRKTAILICSSIDEIA